MMQEFLIFLIVFLFLRYAAHRIPQVYLRKRLLELTQSKLMFQDRLTNPNADYYRELFEETDSLVNQMSRDFRSVNVLYQPALLETSVAELIHLDWKNSYLVIGLDVAEKYRGDKLLRSLLSHELAHHEIRHLHLIQEKLVSYLYGSIHFSMLWLLYRNYSDIASVLIIFLTANALMLVCRFFHRALCRRIEYQCDELSCQFTPLGCLPFMEHNFVTAAADFTPNYQSFRWHLRQTVRRLFSTHPPDAERVRRMRVKIKRESAALLVNV